MKLTTQEQRAILRGEHPRITRPHEGSAPFQRGEEIQLKTLSSEAGPIPQVWITITRVRRSKKGDWVASYSLRDDRSLWLSRQPGYTRSRDMSIDPDAPVDDEATLRRFETEARLSRVERRDSNIPAKERRRKRERAIRDRLRETLAGLDPEGQVELLASIEQKIEGAKQGTIEETLRAA